MCRHLVYLGPPTRLATLLSEAPHGLIHQSWAPCDMRGGGVINVDGFGVGWYTDDGLVRYRRAAPIWSDQNLAELARVTVSGAVLAAVRSASPGLPVNDGACAPFAGDGWLFSHNGRVPGWPESMAKLASRLPVVDLLTLDAGTDAALLWALVRQRLRAGDDPAVVLATTVAEVSAATPESRLNLLLTDGHRVYATTVGHALAVHHTPGRLVVASEPLDDDLGWMPIPDGRLLVGNPSNYTLEEL